MTTPKFVENGIDDDDDDDEDEKFTVSMILKQTNIHIDALI